MNIPSNSSWCVKKILQLRPLALSHLRYSVGGDSRLLFWHDPWCGGKPLLSHFDSSIFPMTDTISRPLVGDFIIDGNWVLPVSNHTWVMELRSMVNMVLINTADSVKWDHMLACNVIVSGIWNSVRVSRPKLPWVHAVWNSLAVAKCSFTFWLDLNNKLLTKERMVSFSMNSDLRCVLCGNAIEINEHLFSTCNFSRQVICNAGFTFTCNWGSYLAGNFLLGTHSIMKKLIAYLYLSAAIYLLWKERNDRMHIQGHRASPALIKFMTKRLVREKVFSSRSFQKAASKEPDLIPVLH